MLTTTILQTAILVKLGKKIKGLRILKGLNQSQFSLECGMEKSSMSKIESGQVNISYLTLHRLSDCLGVTMMQLCDN